MRYFLKHGLGTVDLEIAGDRFVVKTQGTGLIDKLRTIDISLADLKHFCVVPTIGAQNLVAPGQYDTSYQSELIFSYAEGTKTRKKRLFVNSLDPAFQAVAAELAQRRPDASLMHLSAEEAQKTIGVVSGKAAVILVVAIGLALPLVAIAIALLTGH